MKMPEFLKVYLESLSDEKKNSLCEYLDGAENAVDEMIEVAFTG